MTGMPQFLEETMKRERPKRFKDQELYRAMDSADDNDMTEAEKTKTEKTLSKFKINDPLEDTRYNGVFIYGKEQRIKVDPIRYNEKVGLGEKQKEVMAKRKTHYFIPCQKKYLDYNCNIFKTEIADIKSKWINEHKPIVDAAIANITSKKYTPDDDYKLMCGISSPGAANARAQWATAMAAHEAEYKRFGLKTSMYAQFFHLMVSRIEAITIYVLTKNEYARDKFSRNALYTFKNNTKGMIAKLDGFKEYDEMYCIWNFIKHNSLSTFKALNDNYPEVIINKGTYQQGDLAIYFVDLNESLILNLLEGVGRFFDAYCKLVFNEDIESAYWNYDQYFIDQVNNEIENFTNPLGLDIFDDID